MTHFFANVLSGAAVVLLAGVVAYFGRKINRKLGQIIDLPAAMAEQAAALAKLADAVKGWDGFRVDVDRRLRAHDSQLGTLSQRVTIIETRKDLP